MTPLRVFVVLGAVLLPSCRVSSPSAARPTAPSWIERDALSTEPGARQRSLLEHVASHRVVYLGEPDHYVQEKYAMRLFFIRELFARGWRNLAMEMGRADGAHVDAYLASGDEQELERVGIYSAAGIRTPRSGVLKGLPPAARSEFLAAERSFLRALRTLSEARPTGTDRLHWIGIDVDTDPLAVSERMAPAGPELRATLARAATANPNELAESLSALAPRLSPGEVPSRADLETLADSWRFAAVAFHEPTLPALLGAYATREQTMFRQMDAALVDPRPWILMGHTMHLSKASGSVRFTRSGAKGGQSWRTIGTHVAERLPGQVYSVWMLSDHGEHFDVASCPLGPCPVVTRPGSVEHELARFGSQFALPLQHAEPPLTGRVDWRQNGGDGSGVLTEQADLVWFVRETTTPHAW